MSRRTISLVVLAAVFVAILWFAPTVLLLLFAGILVAVFLTGGGDKLAEWLGLSRVGGLALFALLLLAAFGAFIAGAAPFLAEQVDQLWRQVPEAIASLRERLQSYSWSRELIQNVEPKEVASQATSSGMSAVSMAAGMVVSLGNAVIVLFLGLYLAINPDAYVRGFALLFDPSLRPRVRMMLRESGVALRGWIGAQLVSMAVVGVLTWLGLWFLGVPLAPVLGLLAGLLAFIPNLGPILGAAPAVLLAMTEGWSLALQVIALTLAVQTVESYLVTPTLQKESVDLPPALTIAAQLLFGVLFGTLGLALATPLAAAVLRVTRIFYVKGWLDDRRASDRMDTDPARHPT
ncbi:AI-2E family transporter [Chthonobacter rhizosphaerae]|uniref:AI-2E family transporter n=1 Tax=Chthonobacter rhizosphaerae TaxID=2735553 RepID=UPI0015EE5AD0|nr:AI-2E family transporter [Chthonobacter rhizosphaerae]